MSSTVLDRTTGTLETDSSEYELLMQAAHEAPKEHAWLEIGTRAGGSAELLMKQMNPGQTFISVDPYGGIPFWWKTPESQILVNGTCLGYTNDMRSSATVSLFEIARQAQVNFIPLPLEDWEFMRRFADGVPTYANGYKRFESTYDLVFLDGPHDEESVANEMSFFAPRMSNAGLIVIDDIELHPELPKKLAFKHSMELLLGQRKLVLRRVTQ